MLINRLIVLFHLNGLMSSVIRNIAISIWLPENQVLRFFRIRYVIRIRFTYSVFLFDDFFDKNVLLKAFPVCSAASLKSLFLLQLKLTINYYKRHPTHFVIIRDITRGIYVV